MPPFTLTPCFTTQLEDGLTLCFKDKIEGVMLDSFSHPVPHVQTYSCLHLFFWPQRRDVNTRRSSCVLHLVISLSNSPSFSSMWISLCWLLPSTWSSLHLKKKKSLMWAFISLQLQIPFPEKMVSECLWSCSSKWGFPQLQHYFGPDNSSLQGLSCAF